MDTRTEDICYTTMLQTMLADKTKEMLSLASLSRIILKEEYQGKDENWLEAVLRAFGCKNVNQFGHRVFSSITHIRDIESIVSFEYEMMYRNLKICLKDDNQKINSIINKMKGFAKNKEIDWMTKDGLNKSVWDSLKEFLSNFKMFLLSLRTIHLLFRPNIDIFNEFEDISDEIKKIVCTWKMHPSAGDTGQTMLEHKTKEMLSLASLSRIILTEEYQGKDENWLDAVLRAFVCKNVNQFGHCVFASVTHIRDIESIVSFEYEMMYQNMRIRLKDDSQKVNSIINEINDLAKKKEMDWMMKDGLSKSVWDSSKEVLSNFKMFLLSLSTITLLFHSNIDVVNELQDISDEIKSFFCMWKMNPSAGDTGINGKTNNVDCGGFENNTSYTIYKNKTDNSIPTVWFDNTHSNHSKPIAPPRRRRPHKLISQPPSISVKENTINISHISKPETTLDNEMYICDICNAQFEKYLTYNISYEIHSKSKHHLDCIPSNWNKTISQSSIGSPKEAKLNDEANNSFDTNNLVSGIVSKPVQKVIPLVQVEPQIVSDNTNRETESLQSDINRISVLDHQSATAAPICRLQPQIVSNDISRGSESCCSDNGSPFGSHFSKTETQSPRRIRNMFPIRTRIIDIRMPGSSCTIVRRPYLQLPQVVIESTTNRDSESLQNENDSPFEGQSATMGTQSTSTFPPGTGTRTRSHQHHRSCAIRIGQEEYFCLLCKIGMHADELQMHIRGNTHMTAHQYFTIGINENAPFSALSISEKRELIRRKAKAHSGFIDFATDKYYCIFCERVIGGLNKIQTHVNGKVHSDYCSEFLLSFPETHSEFYNNFQNENIASSCTRQRCYMCRLDTTNDYHISTCIILSMLSAEFRNNHSLGLPDWLIDHNLYIGTSENNVYFCWLCDCTIGGLLNVASHIKGHSHMRKYNAISHKKIF